MRIVGGKWRGRRVEAPSGRDVTRPTTDRVRESISSMVMSAVGLDLTGLAVLDAFAGSGAVGLELLSRGADHATFVEADHRVLSLLRKNAESVGAGESARVVAGDVFRLASSGRLPGAPFDVVVLDPPYATEASRVSALVDALADASLLGDAGLVVYERACDRPALALAHAAETLRQKRYGTTCVDLVRVGRSPLA